MKYPLSDIFSRSTLLLGAQTMNALRDTRVIIFGIGGVGSWCAESLVRTGLGHITLVDADDVAVSNINRQQPATTLTVGKSKVEVMRHHLLSINPHLDISVRKELYSADTADSFDLDAYNYIIDAIDTVSDKMLLIERATRSKGKLFSSMGAAMKIDPSKITVSEFWKVTGCPLARTLRRNFKKSGRFPAKKFNCVYSNELLPNHPDSAPNSDPQTAVTAKKGLPNGSLMHITAIFGMILTSLILSDIRNS